MPASVASATAARLTAVLRYTRTSGGRRMRGTLDDSHDFRCVLVLPDTPFRLLSKSSKMASTTPFPERIVMADLEDSAVSRRLVLKGAAAAAGAAGIATTLGAMAGPAAEPVPS